MKVYSHYRQTYRSRNRRYQTGINWQRTGILLLTITAIILLILKVTTWLGAQEVFVFKEIRFEGNRYLSAEELRACVSLDSAENLFDLDLKAIERQVEQHSLVERAMASRQFPSTLKVRVQERQPIALLNQGELVPVDASAQRFPETRPAMLCDLPVISATSDAAELETILAFLRHVKAEQFGLYSRISELGFSPKYGVYFLLMERVLPVVVGHADFDQKSEQFRAVLEMLESEDRLGRLEYIDLRFRGQVIVRNKAHLPAQDANRATNQAFHPKT